MTDLHVHWLVIAKDDTGVITVTGDTDFFLMAQNNDRENRNIDNVKILQCNLGRGMAATQECLKEARSRGYSVLVLQEPYTGRDGILNLPSVEIIQAQMGIDKPVKSAIVILENAFRVTRYPDLSDQNIVCAKIHSSPLNVFIISVYLEKDEDISEYITRLQIILQVSDHSHVIIAGDINARSQWWGDVKEDLRGSQFAEFVLQNDLVIINTGGIPTFSATRNGVDYCSIVDVTVCSSEISRSVTDWKTDPDLVTLSDHRASTFNIITEHPIIQSRPTTRIFNTKKANWTSFRSELTDRLMADLTTDRVKEIKTSEELNKIVEELTDAIELTCHNTIPKLEERKPNKKTIWWNTELEIMKREVIRTRRKLRRANNYRKGFLIEKYVALKEKYKKCLIDARTRSWKRFCTGESKETIWNRLYKILNQSDWGLDSMLKGCDGNVLDPEGSANLLAATFYPEDPESTDDPTHIAIRELNARMLINLKSDLRKHEERIQPITLNEIITVAKSIGPTKAPGYDGFTADICLNTIEAAGDVILKIYNSCLNLGHFPTIWKQAIIRIIKKPMKEDYQHPKSYRPIGLLPVLGKILEKIVARRILWHMGTTGKLSKNQYGFMPQVSTEDALYDAVQIINQGLTQKRLVAVVSIDIEGAFDNAWWPGIIQQLHGTQCPSQLLLTMASYLSNRSVSVQYAGCSVKRSTGKGCIQGSTCGPLMWNILMNPLLIETTSLEAHVQAFADDILVITSAKTSTELSTLTNRALQSIEGWGRMNKLSFAAHKTQAVLITKKLKYDQPIITFCGLDLHMGDSIQVLGVKLDKNLSFKIHLEHVVTKVAKLYKSITRATRPTWGMNSEIVRLIYLAVVEPTVLYAAGVWAHVLSKKYAVKRLTSMTRRFAIAITKAHRTTSTPASICLARILPLDLRVQESHDLYINKRGKPIDDLPGFYVEKRISPFDLPHPAYRNPINFTLAYTQTDIRDCGISNSMLFTDGSKIEGKTAGAVSWWESNKEKKYSTFRLADHCSVFQAEQVAILKALELLQKPRTKFNNPIILSDSRSALEALRNPDNCNPVVAETQQNLTKLRDAGVNVKFIWIKAHEGIPGNERADHLAKSAALTKKTSPVYDAVPISKSKLIIRENTIKQWQTRYSNTPTGAITRFFFPEVKSAYKVLKTIEMNNITAQLLTGHGAFKAYLFKFKLTDSPFCPCDGSSDQTIVHVLDECSIFSALRTDYEIQLGHKIVSQNYAVLLENKETRSKFLEYSIKLVRKLCVLNGYNN